MTTTVAQLESEIEAGLAGERGEVPSDAVTRPGKDGMRAGLFLGLLTGFAGGTLLAPRAGRELLQEIREELRELAAHPDALPARVRTRLADLPTAVSGEGAREATGWPLGRARTWVQAARDRVRESIEQGRAASREAQTRLREEYRRMTGRQG